MLSGDRHYPVPIHLSLSAVDDMRDICAIEALTPRTVSRPESNSQLVNRRWKNPVLEKALNAAGNRAR